MSVNFSGKTDLGYKMDLNEDLIVAESLSDNKEMDDDYLLMVLDGNGASIKAQQNPEMVVQPVYLVANTIKSVLKKAYREHRATFLSDPMIFLKVAFEAANLALGTFRMGDEEIYGNFSSCVTAVFFHGDKGYGLHCGNTRAYLFKKSKDGGMKLVQLTKDHTVAQLKVDSGELDARDYYLHPDRINLYSTIGMSADPVFMPFNVNLKEDEMLLLSTDGLHYAQTSEDIVNIIMSAPNIGDMIDHFISESKRLNHIDNIALLFAYRKEWVESVILNNPNVSE